MAPGGLIVLAGMACSILTASFAVLSSTSSPARAASSLTLTTYIGGVPRAVVERRMQRGQLIGGPLARVPLYVPYADFFQYQAGAGRLAGRA
jgi:hypothetical protein